MKTEINEKNIKNFVVVLITKVNNSEIYKVYPVLGQNAWRLGVHEYMNPNGDIVRNSDYTVIAIPKENYTINMKCLPNTKKYYKQYSNPYNKFITQKDAFDVTDKLHEMTSYHKYMNFYLLRYKENVFMKVPEKELHEAIRALHRSNFYNIDILHITDDKRKVLWVVMILLSTIHTQYTILMKHYIHLRNMFIMMKFQTIMNTHIKMDT